MVKRSAKRFLLNAENYIDFAVRNPLTKQASNTPHSINKLCSEFAPRNAEHSAFTENDKTISKLAQKTQTLISISREQTFHTRFLP